MINLNEIRWFMAFSKKLNRLISSGHPLDQALLTVRQDESQSDKQLRIHALIKQLEQGQTFSQSLITLLPQPRPTLSQIATVPDIPLFLDHLHYLYGLKLALYTRILQKLAYPLFLLIAALLGGTGFIFVILPMYSSFFNNLNTDIPAFIQTILNGAAWINTNKLTFSFGLLGGVGLLVIFFGPLIKSLWIRAWASPLCDLLWMIGLYLKQGVQMKTILEGCDTKNLELISRFRERYYETGQFTQSLTDTCTLKPFYAELLRNAEKSQHLADQCLEIADDLLQEKNQQMNRILGILPIILLLILGICLFLFVYIIFLPVLQSAKLLG